jgi:hypothetical protein
MRTAFSSGTLCPIPADSGVTPVTPAPRSRSIFKLDHPVTRGWANGVSSECAGWGFLPKSYGRPHLIGGRLCKTHRRDQRGLVAAGCR